MTRPPKPALGRDAMLRSAESEADISDLVLSALSTLAGAKLLDYLRNITLHRTLGPGASDAELRDLEGQRRLVAMLIMRCDDARRNREQGRPGG